MKGPEEDGLYGETDGTAPVQNSTPSLIGHGSHFDPSPVGHDRSALAYLRRYPSGQI